MASASGETWTHDSGMVAAYVHLPMLICIQLGRAHPIPVSIVSFDLSFRLPRFSGDELHLEHFDYQVVAACTHLGKSGAGHYRAALLLCDDGEQPTKIHTIPCWFSTQVCLLWAVRISAKSPLAHCPVQAAVVVFSRLWFSHSSFTFMVILKHQSLLQEAVACATLGYAQRRLAPWRPKGQKRQPKSDGLQPTTDGLQPLSDGLQPFLLLLEA